MPVVLDAMGSDKFPTPEIKAAIEACKEFNEPVYLVGNESILSPFLKESGGAPDNLKIIDAPDVLEMGEKPVDAARRKPKNSMAVGMQLLKSGEAQAFVSAGNTGAIMFNALRVLGRLPGVQRPALTAMFPVRTGSCVVLDIGANAECRPEFLSQFAILGATYAEKALGRENPRVGLLSNGEEPGKGNQLIQDSYKLIKELGLNFLGNVEGKELFAGEVDVVVTDGFTGNILLKTSESVAKLMTDLLRQELTSNLQNKIGALIAKPAFAALKKKMDPSEIGAAPLLGIDGLVYVGHGRSDSVALLNALRAARQAVKINLLESLRGAVKDRLVTAAIDSHAAK